MLKLLHYLPPKTWTLGLLSIGTQKGPRIGVQKGPVRKRLVPVVHRERIPRAPRRARLEADARRGAGPPLLDMERALRPHDNAKWTVVSYLPFLRRPEAHMFLKPEVTQDFATRVGHRFRFDYEPRLEIGVYDSLLDLTRQTELELAELQPRDRIDVQSFIWVVGGYKH